MSKAGIKDVARLAGVSTATVSYVLNGTRTVSDATHQRVLEAARQLGYRPNVTARALQAQRNYLIGYSWRPLPPHNNSPVLDRFIHSMGQAAYNRGYHLLAFPAPSDQDEVAVYEDLVTTNRVDGIVLSATNLDDPRVAYLMDTTMPFVAFGRAGPESPYPWVDVDGEAGMELAVEHLVAQGHRRIGILAWPPGSQSGEDRYRGYLKGIEAAGLPLHDEWVIRVDHAVQEGHRGMGRLLALDAETRPTALLCISDLVAMGAMNAAQDAGLRVGPDIGIVGFDDMPLAEHLRPSLTTIHQPVEEIGELVIHQLTQLFREGSLPPERRQLLLKPTLKVRDSTKRNT